MSIFRDSCVCLFFAMVCLFVSTQGLHEKRDRRIASGLRLVQGSPRLRARMRVRPTVILPTRNTVRRNLSPIRPNLSIFHHQPTRRFQNSGQQFRISNGNNVHTVPHASIKPTWPSVPALSDELLRRQSLDNRAQFAGRRPVVDTAKNPFVSRNSLNVMRHQDVISQTNKNSLLKLLDERRPVIHDERDGLLIRSHLTELNRLRNGGVTNTDKRLQNQVNYIEQIVGTDIQREVLKIFVKDIVEKSGFLNMNPNTVQDISSLQTLVDKIQLITDKFTNLEPSTFLGQAILSETPLITKATITPAPVTFQTSTGRHNSNQETDLRQRILHALSTYDRAEHVPETRGVELGMTSGDTRAFQGRPRVGLSIFGRSDQPTTTLQSITTEVKRDNIGTEPLGGNGAYWTHLSSGLADMLCNLCQQRGIESCIVRYCTNNVIVESVEPQTQSTKSLPEMTTSRML